MIPIMAPDADQKDKRKGKKRSLREAKTSRAHAKGSRTPVEEPDPANLGWKLAAVILGEMPESLLDTYTGERRPVAVLANTLSQAAIMRPDPQSGALREVVGKLDSHLPNHFRISGCKASETCWFKRLTLTGYDVEIAEPQGI